MHDNDTYVLMGPDKMNPQQRQETMTLLIFISKKQNGTIKSCTCADGSVQKKQPGYKKEDLTSPTVSTSVVLINRAIEAREKHIIVWFDIPGAFLNVNCKGGYIYASLRPTCQAYGSC